MKMLRFLLLLLTLPVLAQEVVQLDTVAELASVNPKLLGRLDGSGVNRATAFVRRYSTNVAIGIGAGIYVHDPDGTTTNAYGGSFAATGGGTWELVSPPTIADFGARPDVLRDNTPNIQAFIDYYQPTTPPTNHALVTFPPVIIPEGRWVIQTPLLLKKGTWLHGESYTGSILQSDWSQNGLTASSLTQTGGTATLTTSAAHGLTSGDFVLISGADQDGYNEIHHVTVTGSTTVTFPVDSSTVSPATGTLVVTRHPFLIMNWSNDPTDEFADDGDTTVQQNNFGIEHMTLMPQTIDTNYPPPAGTWMLRLRSAVEPVLREVRFPIHLGSIGVAASKNMGAVWLESCTDIDFEDVTVDQGKYGFMSSTRFGGPSGVDSGRVVNCFFFSQSEMALGLSNWYRTRFAGITMANLGYTSGDANLGLVITNSTSNKFTDWEIGSGYHTAIVLGSDRNEFANIRIHAGATGDNPNIRKVGFDLYGDGNVIEGLSSYGLKVGIRRNDGADGNVIGNYHHEQTPIPFQGFTSDSPQFPHRSDLPGHVWNFAGVSTFAGDYLSGTLTDTIGSGDSFTVHVQATSNGTTEDVSADRSQGLLSIGPSSTPASGGGSARLFISSTGEIVWTHYGSTSSDYRITKTTTNAWPRGQPHDFFVSRSTDGTVAFNLDGYPLAQLTTTTSGTAPGATDAITGTNVAVGAVAASSVNWNGTIGSFAILNTNLTRGEIEQFRNRSTRVGHQWRRGLDEPVNGGFETDTTGWASDGSATITRTASGAHSGTYSLQIAASATDGGAETTTLGNTSSLVKYYVTFYYQYVSGGTAWQVGRADGTGATAFTVNSDGSWHAVTATVGGVYPPPADALNLRSTSGASTIRIDDVTVRRIGALAAFSADSPVVNGTVTGWDGVSTATFANGEVEQIPAVATMHGTVGATDNTLVRANGASGQTVQGSAVVVEDYTSSTAPNVAIRVDDGSATDISAVVTPKGAGAFLLGPKPDGTTTGGNARGNYAVDLQLSRGDASQVASGSYSAVLSGLNNTASGNYSTAVGYGAKADKIGQVAFASGNFASAGDSQACIFNVRKSTSSTTPVTLYTDGGSGKLTLPSNTTATFVAYVTGTSGSGTGYVYSYKLEGVIRKGTSNASTSMPVAVSKTVFHEHNASADVDAVADTTYGSLSINVTPADSTTVRWSALVIWNQVTY